MRYIRTKNGVIIDLEKFINNEKDTPYYTDFIFDEITKDGNLKWTAVGTDKNTMENQRGRRCQFGATLNSEIISQADTIEELCDEFDWKWNEKEFPYSKVRQHSRYGGYGDLERAMKEEENYGKHLNYDYEIYGAIWTDKGLTYVAKLNSKGELELL
jgi:hypothetical protein